MSDQPAPITPLIVEFTVAADATHAFELWTGGVELWWPAGHTVSGDPAAITFEPRPGGRIVERAPDGTEHVWGEVLVWEPPNQVHFRWHLFFTPADATRVALTFTPADGGTRVRLVQTGWADLGQQGPTRRERTVQGWAAVTRRYRDVIDHRTPGGDP